MALILVLSMMAGVAGRVYPPRLEETRLLLPIGQWLPGIARDRLAAWAARPQHTCARQRTDWVRGLA